MCKEEWYASTLSATAHDPPVVLTSDDDPPAMETSIEVVGCLFHSNEPERAHS